MRLSKDESRGMRAMQMKRVSVCVCVCACGRREMAVMLKAKPQSLLIMSPEMVEAKDEEEMER